MVALDVGSDVGYDVNNSFRELEAVKGQNHRHAQSHFKVGEEDLNGSLRWNRWERHEILPFSGSL